jgi:hypothetical protein
MVLEKAVVMEKPARATAVVVAVAAVAGVVLERVVVLMAMERAAAEWMEVVHLGLEEAVTVTEHAVGPEGQAAASVVLAVSAAKAGTVVAAA